MTVEALEPHLTMRELLAWQRFEDDFGPLTLHERIDHAAALISYTVAAAAGLKNDRGRAVEIVDFLPTWQREGEAPSVAEWFKAVAS